MSHILLINNIIYIMSNNCAFIQMAGLVVIRTQDGITKMESLM